MLASSTIEQPENAGVRLEVRLGNGRANTYEIGNTEFLIGNASGCDLRLPGSHLPPVICQLLNTPEGLRIRKLSAIVAISINQQQLSSSNPVPIKSGDIVRVANAEIQVHMRDEQFLKPKLILFDDATENRPAEPPTEPELPSGATPEPLEDRAAQYRRKIEQQIEEELQRRLQSTAMPATTTGPTEPQLSQLEAIRQELQQERESLDRERRWQHERLKDLDEALLQRHEELTRREEQLQAERDQFDHEREIYKEDLLRNERRQSYLESTQAILDSRTAEVNERLELLRKHAVEWEETLRQADEEQARIRTESERLQAREAELDDRAASLDERAAKVESQQASLAIVRANLLRQQEAIHQESAAVAAEHQRLYEIRQELDAKLRETESVRAELGLLKEDHVQESRATTEHNLTLAATIEQHRQAEARLREQELELDARTSEFAEQVALLKARIAQVTELQERLELDRSALKNREAKLAENDAARAAFQEQLRKRAEELSQRSREVDELRVKLAEERVLLEGLRESQAQEKSREEQRLASEQDQLATRSRDLEERGKALAEREETLARQVARLKEVGEHFANERKALYEARTQFERERATASEQEQEHRQQTEAIRAKVAAHFEELRRQAPNLDEQAKASLERLASAREVIRGNLAELHEFARQTREDLDAVRNQLQHDHEQLHHRTQELEGARSEHRLSVVGFRQQLLDWQSKIGELKHQFATAEEQIEQRQSHLDAVEQQITETREDLLRQAEEMAAERRKVTEKKSEMERHLGDMRDWYRRKLRELAAGRKVDETDMPRLSDEKPNDILPLTPPVEPDTEPEPGDQHLGELLKTRGLVDEGTLQALWAEARRQRRTLRQTLLASGALTLYQLALIEGGNLDGLMLGRLRVVDRVRATSKETVYRVFDPTRPGGSTRGIYLLRHLSESEMQDAVHPDEFRQRFQTMAQAHHPNLANTLEILEINKRPAALQEWVAGLSSADWPPAAATPGVWLRLLRDAARGIQQAHRAGLVHGRLASDCFLLTADGTLKMLGFGEPPWLQAVTQSVDLPAAVDLRSLGQVAYQWSQLGSRRRGIRIKPFPVELTNVIRRLEIGSEPPMGDVVAIESPYHDAAELVRDLERLSEEHPCPTDTWEKLCRFAADHVPEQIPTLRATG